MSTEVSQDRRSSSEWRLVLLGLLEAQDTPRVCTTQDVARLLRQVRPRATAATLHSAIEGLTRAGALQKVSRGLFLNRRPSGGGGHGSCRPYPRRRARIS
jgi:Fe2+ or Zn2+ uptake regulation protein